MLTDYPALLAAFLRSAGAAGPAALLAAAFALPIAYLSVRYPSPLARTLDRLAYIGYAIPPLTLALALVFFSLRSAPWLYQTLPLLVIAYALSFLALALGPIRSSLLQAKPSLEEAARSLGRSSFGAFSSVSLPLLRRGTLAGMTLVFIIAMKELPITFLLAPTGYTTLAVSVFSRTSEAMLAEAAPFAAAIVLFSSLFIGLVLTYEGKR
jgi:iron(III) transport system permease protein